MNNLSIRNSHPIGKAVIFFTFCLFSLIIGSLLTNGLMEILNISIESKLGLQLMTFIGQLTGFILPAILFIVVFGRDSVGGFHLNSTSPIYWVLTFLLAVSAMGIVAYSGEINLKILEGRGGFIAELKKLEDQAALTTETMLEMKNIGQLLLNLFLVAVVPAICEELAFRGVLQSQLAKSFKNIHLAIWVTAIIFSAIHFQFFGFLPRMVLGAIFGYVLIYSGSIWMPILAHFINNSIFELRINFKSIQTFINPISFLFIELH